MTHKTVSLIIIDEFFETGVIVYYRSSIQLSVDFSLLQISIRILDTGMSEQWVCD